MIFCMSAVGFHAKGPNDMDGEHGEQGDVQFNHSL